MSTTQENNSTTLDSQKLNCGKVSEKVQQWNRAIPEAGLVTLGTLRFGVRLSNPNLSLVDTTNSSLSSSSNNPSINTSSNSSNGGKTNCCCIGSTGIALPWTSNYVRTRLPVPTMAKNRSPSPSSSSAAAASASFNRESSPTSACCYTHSNRTVNNLKNNSLIYSPSSSSSLPPAPSSKQQIKRTIDYKSRCDNVVGINKNNECDKNKIINKNQGDSFLSDKNNKNIKWKSDKNNKIICENNNTKNDFLNEKLEILNCFSSSSHPVKKNLLSFSETQNDSITSSTRLCDNKKDENINFHKKNHFTEQTTTTALAKRDCSGKYNSEKSEHPNKIHSTVVIRKLTPKLNKKNNNFNNQQKTINNNDDEDFSYIDSSSASDDLKWEQQKNNQETNNNKKSFLYAAPKISSFVLKTNSDERSDDLVDDEKLKEIYEQTKFKYKKLRLDKKDDEVFENIVRNNFVCSEDNLDLSENNKLSLLPPKYQHFKKISADNSQSSLNCFGKSSVYSRLSPEKIPTIMEKRRNTLDRFQRLGFGRRSASNPPDGKTTETPKKDVKKPSDKTERLKELTEMLKGSRAPPPIPPPRRPRQHIFEKQDSIEIASTSSSNNNTNDESETPQEKKTSVDVSDNLGKPPEIPTPKRDSTNSIFDIPTVCKNKLLRSLRPNTSASDLEHFILQRNSLEDSIRTPPIAPNEDDFFTNVPRAESRTIVGSYTQKSIPFRSASFSQVDYTSGKYIRSALGALKSTFLKDRTTTVVDHANLTLPRKKSRSRSTSPNPIVDDKMKEEEESLENPEIKMIDLINEQEEGVILEEKEIRPDNRDYDDDNESSEIQFMDRTQSSCSVDTIHEEDGNDIHLAEVKIASEMTLETLTEEEIPIDAIKNEDSFLQTATTCLIPVPVYECVNQEEEKWINVSDNETSPKQIEAMGISLDMMKEIKECDIGPDIIDDLCGSSHELNSVKVIEQILGTSEIIKESDSSQVPESVESIDNEDDAPTTPTSEFVEVRKRHSNNQETRQEVSTSPEKSSPNDPSSPSGDERRKIDKSRRRKGIYIQWPTTGKATDPEGTPEDDSTPEDKVPWQCDKITQQDVDLDLSSCDFSTIKKPLHLSCSNKTLDEENRKSDSQCSMEPATPDSDSSRPVWPKCPRRQSLTCQSSDEKDDPPVTASPNKPYRSLFYFKQDSISDNESDKTPPRDRSSASPAPPDQEMKRYSKRPVRGPYGQILEAEMKKPNKLNYDEVLEDLNRDNSSNMLYPPNRNRGAGSQSLDDSNNSTKTQKPRKTSANLPVPCHTRAASTPSQTDMTTPEPIVAHHRRYPSIDQFNDKTKKLSLDSNLDKSKRASSEVQDKNPKRNSSGASEKSFQKRSFDEIRLSQVSRTPSERSVETPKGGGILPTPELLAELLKGSSERLAAEQNQMGGAGSGSTALPSAVLKCLDTRTHVVVELFNTEQSYVESLETVVAKYLNPLKSPEYAGIIDAQVVDEIFFKVPAILSLHQRFLDELRRRLDSWDPLQKVGDAFVEVFSTPTVLDTYTSFVNNWNKAKDAIRTSCSTRQSFAKFLEAMTREHKRKLSLDNLLIKPVQKFPNYELIFTRLIKHTDVDHPDQKPLQDALKLVHDILLHLNCKEREALENGQREAALRDLENVIEGVNDLITPERSFLLFDLVSMPSGQVTGKDRGFFLFNDLLVITSIKRRTGTIRKPNTTCPQQVSSTLDTNKYKFLTKFTLDDLEIVKAKDENIRKIMKEIELLSEDCNKIQQISELTSTLRCSHQILEDTIRDLHREVQRQLTDRQSNDTQLSLLELTINLPNGIQNMSVVFSKPEKRTQWEETFTEAKQKLAATLERPVPEFLNSIPIRKTRAGLQFTCATPTLGSQKDVWVCNSDGYVGQVCVMSLVPEPTVTSCNGVCNARIMCIASVPANIESHGVSISVEDTTRLSQHSSSSDKKSNITKDDPSDIQLDSESSSEESETESHHPERAPSPAIIPQHQHQESNPDETDCQQSTMWLGTEDGCIHVYNCTDNIRIKKNKIKIQHISAVYSILYLDNRVFVSLANGDISVYLRDHAGWNTNSPLNISIGTVSSPVTKLISVHGKLWCAIQGIIKVLNTSTLQVENQIQISSDAKPITNMTVSHNCVWISVQNSAHIKCFHSTSYELIFEVNLAPSVNKMLSNCDDIIRQHKAACLRVTSLLACKDLIWIGTSAGVLLTIPAQSTNKGPNYIPIVTGLPHGHTGHVRFMTFVEHERENDKIHTNRHSIHIKPKSEQAGILVISGGDGYEDFRSSGTNLLSEVAGREDSTNHLLLWHV